MKYLSVCSGIEAATVAWEPLGWQAAAFAEIDTFPAAVLAHHYPGVPNLGDFTKIQGDEFEPVDLIVGGTPCQAFSIAGKREGLDDERGNLTLEFLRLVGRLRPLWVGWENVPGVLSLDGGRTFGTILGELGQLGYGFAYRILDAQYFGVPQRRRRIFLVGHLGDWRLAAAVLFERHSLSWDSPPGRGSGADVAGAFAAGTYSGGSGGRPEFAASGYFQPAMTLSARQTRQNAGDEFFIPSVSRSLRARHDSSEDGRGRQNLVITPIDMRQATREVKERDCNQPGAGFGEVGEPAFSLSRGPVQAVAYAVRTANTGANGLGVAEDMWRTLDLAQGQAIAFHGSQDPDVSGDVTHPVGRNQGQEVCVLQGRWRGDDGRGYDRPPHVADLPSLDAQKVDMIVPLAFTERGRKEGRTLEAQADLSYALTNPGAGGRSHSRQIMDGHSSVRRLTPRECERLQGFPDDYTLVPYRGKPAADGPRYKAIGNSMAVPVMRWIGERIAAVEKIKGELTNVI